jgi:hypothetical protein
MRIVSFDTPENKTKGKNPGRSKQPMTPERMKLKLPPLHSDEWKTIEMPPPPKSLTKAKRRD